MSSPSALLRKNLRSVGKTMVLMTRTFSGTTLRHVASSVPAVRTRRGKGAQTFDSVFMYKHNDEMVFADLDFSAQHCWNLLDLFRTNSASIRVLDSNWDFH